MNRLLGLALVLSASLAGCGGGDSGGGNDSINLKSFALSETTLSAPSTGSVDLTATWSVSASGKGEMYHLEAHAIPVNDANQNPSDENKFLGRNCIPGAAPCSDPQTVPCTFSSSGRLSCNSFSSLNLTPGTYRIVAQACYVKDVQTDICSTQESTLTVL